MVMITSCIKVYSCIKYNKMHNRYSPPILPPPPRTNSTTPTTPSFDLSISPELLDADHAYAHAHAHHHSSAPELQLLDINCATRQTIFVIRGHDNCPTVLESDVTTIVDFMLPLS